MTSHNKTQPNVQVKIGVLADRPVAGQVNPGTISYTTDAPPSIDVADATTGVRAWLPLAGSGGSSIYPKYWVSKNAIAPFTPFTTIQSAINQAATDGHSATVPAAIYITPGTYVENVSLKDGIDLIGIGSQSAQDISDGASAWNSDIIINGNVTLAAGFTKASIADLSIVAASGAAVALGSNATVASMSFFNCSLATTSAAGPVFSGAPTNGPTIYFDNCQLTNNASPGGSAAVLGFTTLVSVQSSNSSFTPFISSDIALSFVDGIHIFRGGKIDGKYVQVGPWTGTGDKFQDVDMGVSSGSALTTVAPGTVTWTRGSIAGATAGAMFTGTGTVSFKDNFTLPKYWVAPPNRFPFAPYTTIQSAINAAAADGHSIAAQTTICVLPDIYVGNVIMKDGISLLGVTPSSQFRDLSGGLPVTSPPLAVTISGSISFDAGFLVGAISNIQVQSFTSAIPAIDFGTSGMVSFEATDCALSTNKATPVIAGAPTGGPVVYLNNCAVKNFTTQGGAAGISFTTAADVQAMNSSFQCHVGTDSALSFAGGTHRFEGCQIFGNELHSAAATDTFSDCDLAVTGATSYFNVSAGAPTITWKRGSRTGSTSATPYTGTFTFNDSDHGGDVNSETILSTMTTTATRTARKLTAAATVGATVSAAQFQAAGDVVIVDTSGGAGSVTLPARNLVGAGTIKWIVASPAGAFAITATRAGGDTIDGVGGNIATTAVIANAPSLCLMADPNNTTNWLVLSRS